MELENYDSETCHELCGAVLGRSTHLHTFIFTGYLGTDLLAATTNNHSIISCGNCAPALLHNRVSDCFPLFARCNPN